MPIEFDKSGLIIQNLTEILDEREDDLKEILDDDFVVSAKSIVGNLQLSDADREQAIQELCLYIATQLDPNQAEGIWLDFICQYNGITREVAKKTTCYFTVKGTPNVSKSAGEVILVESGTDEWLLNKNAFIIGSDGTASVKFEATSYGDTEFNPNSTYELKTPSIGIDEITYDDTKTQSIGRFRETDGELRARRLLFLQEKASSVKASIQSEVELVPDVEYVKVYENDTMETKDTLPPKSFEVVVMGGEDEDIANAIFLKKPVGIQSFGQTEKTIIDEDDDEFTIGFTRPTVVQTDLTVSYTVEDISQQRTWETDLKQQLCDYFDDSINVGDTVYVYKMGCILNDYSQIINVTNFQIRKHNEEQEQQWGDKVTVEKRQIAKCKPENITFVVTQEGS